MNAIEKRACLRNAALNVVVAETTENRCRFLESFFFFSLSIGGQNTKRLMDDGSLKRESSPWYVYVTYESLQVALKGEPTGR